MNPRHEISIAYVLVWMILGCAVSSIGKPLDVNDSGLTELPISQSINEANESSSSSGGATVAADKTIESAASVLIPQVGFLEERSDVSGIGKDPLPVIVATPNASGTGVGQSAGSPDNAGNGILVPIVSVVDGASSSSNNGIMNHPLVALLPAPSADGQASMLPEISSLPVIQAVPARQEMRRSVEFESRADRLDDKSSEIMDVAEDIVFRPLFAVRQAAAASSYTARNSRKNYRPNYRRYNVQGFYRIPNNNYYRSNDRDSEEYSDE